MNKKNLTHRFEINSYHRNKTKLRHTLGIPCARAVTTNKFRRTFSLAVLKNLSNYFKTIEKFQYKFLTIYAHSSIV